MNHAQKLVATTTGIKELWISRFIEQTPEKRELVRFLGKEMPIKDSPQSDLFLSAYYGLIETDVTKQLI